MKNTLQHNWDGILSGSVNMVNYGQTKTAVSRTAVMEKNFRVTKPNVIKKISIRNPRTSTPSIKVILFTLKDGEIFYISPAIKPTIDPKNNGNLYELKEDIPITQEMGYFAVGFSPILNENVELTQGPIYIYDNYDGVIDKVSVARYDPGAYKQQVGEKLSFVRDWEDHFIGVLVELEEEIEDDLPEFDITEKYHDNEGKELRADTITTILKEETYNKTAPDIFGYEYVGYILDGSTIQKGQTAVLQDIFSDHEVIFIYKKKEDNDGNNNCNNNGDNCTDNENCSNCCCGGIKIGNINVKAETINIYNNNSCCCCGSKSAAQDSTPVGTVMYYTATEAPEGWLECNGAEVSRSQYSKLFEIAGTIFGEGDGSSTFNLPDLRGEFIRGYDHEREVDKEREFGSWQKGSIVNCDAVESFVSMLSLYNASDDQSEEGSWKAGGYDSFDYEQNYQDLGYAWMTTAENITKVQSKNIYGVAGATRPRNVALLPCIKY